MMAFN